MFETRSPVESEGEDRREGITLGAFLHSFLGSIRKAGEVYKEGVIKIDQKTVYKEDTTGKEITHFASLHFLFSFDSSRSS